MITVHGARPLTRAEHYAAEMRMVQKRLSDQHAGTLIGTLHPDERWRLGCQRMVKCFEEWSPTWAETAPKKATP